MTSTLETLIAARALLTPEGSWTQWEIAKNAAGKRVNAGRATAVCWCAFGAICRFDGGYWMDSCEAIESVIGIDLVAWNDDPSRTHAEVLQAFDVAIRRCQDGLA